MPVEERITATPAALEELARLRERHGPLLLFLSGGCCEGSFPLCLEEGELLLGPGDRRIGELGGVPFYVDADQDERWNRPSFVLDLVDCESDTFSLENADRVHFVARNGACGVPKHR